MKNSNRILITAIAIIFSLSSCSKEDLEPTCTTCGGGNTIGLPITQVIEPAPGTLVIGGSYWALTSAPAGITGGVGLNQPNPDVLCTPIRIVITGTDNLGNYQFQVDPSMTPGVTVYIPYYADIVKSEITTALHDYAFVIVVF